MYCVVEKCRSIWIPNSSIKFHSIPKDAEKRSIWLSNIKLKGKMYKSAKICSNHFKPEDYDPEKPGHLLDSAVPFFATQSCDCDTTASLDIKPKTAAKQQDISNTDTMFNKAEENSFKMDIRRQEERIQAIVEEAKNDKDKDNLFTRIWITRPNIDSSGESSSEQETDHCSEHAVNSDTDQEGDGGVEVGSSQEDVVVNDTNSNPEEDLPLSLLRATTSTSRHLITALTSSKRSWQVPKPLPSHLHTKVKEEDEPPHKRPRLKDFNMQVKMKSPREVSLEKTKKILQQKITRQQKQINNLQTLISIVRKYTGKSEIENILQGSFKNICNTFNSKPKSKTMKYSDGVKAFASTMNSYSPKAYEYLRTIMELPHPTTLWRSTASSNCDV